MYSHISNVSSSDYPAFTEVQAVQVRPHADNPIPFLPLFTKNIHFVFLGVSAGSTLMLDVWLYGRMLVMADAVAWERRRRCCRCLLLPWGAHVTARREKSGLQYYTLAPGGKNGCCSFVMQLH